MNTETFNMDALDRFVLYFTFGYTVLVDLGKLIMYVLNY